MSTTINKALHFRFLEKKKVMLCLWMWTWPHDHSHEPHWITILVIYFYFENYSRSNMLWTDCFVALLCISLPSCWVGGNKVLGYSQESNVMNFLPVCLSCNNCQPVCVYCALEGSNYIVKQTNCGFDRMGSSFFVTFKIRTMGIKSLNLICLLPVMCLLCQGGAHNFRE